MTSPLTAPRGRGIPTPDAAHRGIESRPGGSTPIARPEHQSERRSPLTNLLPEPTTVAAGFDRITVDNPTIASGDSAWINIADISIADTIGEECGLFKVHVSMLSADVDGAGISGASDPVSWGTSKGIGAMIVIGDQSLPVSPDDGWKSMPAPFPGIELDSGLFRSIYRSRGIILAVPFPPGSLSDSIPVPGGAAPAWSPNAWRFKRRDRLRAALVVRGSQINGQTGNLYGYCSLQFHLSLARPTREFDE